MTDTVVSDGAKAAAQSADREYSFEEFRMMYESTECVSDRKIAFMRNNSQLCIAIIAGQGIAASWTFDNTEMKWAIAITIMVIGVLGAYFCRYWVTQLDNLTSLNSAKFQVLEEMADHVVFPDYKLRTIRSKNPFVREYEIMQAKKKVIEDKGRKVPVASEAERTVPQCFLAFFALSALFGAAWFASEILHIIQAAR